MRATTIKVEGTLLREIERAKAPTESVTSFVRQVLERELRRRRSARAAAEYQALLTEDADERHWLEEWEQADLASPVRGARK